MCVCVSVCACVCLCLCVCMRVSVCVCMRVSVYRVPADFEKSDLWTDEYIHSVLLLLCVSNLRCHLSNQPEDFAPYTRAANHFLTLPFKLSWSIHSPFHVGDVG